MEPATLMMVLSATGTAVQVINSLNQGQAQSSAASYNAAVASQNADISRTQAADQRVQQDREMRQRLGAIRASQGKSGGSGDTGSVLDVLGDVAAQSELDKQYTTYQGELKAQGYSNTAALDTAQAANARTSSYFKAGSDLLSGSVSAYSNYNKLRTYGTQAPAPVREGTLSQF